MEWISSQNNKSSSISIVKKTNVRDESNWDEYIEWQLTKAAEFYDVFQIELRIFNIKKDY